MLIQYIIGALLLITGIYFLFSVTVAAVKIYNVDSRAEKMAADAYMLFCFLLNLAAFTVKQFIIIQTHKIKRHV